MGQLARERVGGLREFGAIEQAARERDDGFESLSYWVNETDPAVDEFREDFETSSLGLPAVSDDCVAFVYATRVANHPNDVRVDFVDKNGGYRLDSRVIVNEPSQVRTSVRGLGNALFAITRGRGADKSRMDILRNKP